MTNFTSKNNGTAGTGTGKSAGSYQDRLSQILAQAGNNNPIAAAQARNMGKPDKGQQAPQVPQAPQAAQPQASAPAPAAPQNPNDRLQQILAQAGMTPAQKAQYAAQQKNAANAANITNIIQQLQQALMQDPRKLLLLDIEFSGTNGANEDVYFKCYTDNAGIVYWDVFGCDIDHCIPSSFDQYQLIDSYYRGIPDATVQAELAPSTVNSSQIV